jgi:hypothetical protein
MTQLWSLFVALWSSRYICGRPSNMHSLLTLIQVEHIFEAVNGPTVTHFGADSNQPTVSISSNKHHDNFYSFLLRNAATGHQREDLYPLPSQMLFLWQIYMDNVDPFMKILHVLTMTKVIRELRGSYDSLDAGMQALVLVISLAAIMSLDDEEVSGSGRRFDGFIWLIHLTTGPRELQRRQRSTRCSLSTWY